MPDDPVMVSIVAKKGRPFWHLTAKRLDDTEGENPSDDVTDDGDESMELMIRTTEGEGVIVRTVCGVVLANIVIFEARPEHSQTLFETLISKGQFCRRCIVAVQA